MTGTRPYKTRNADVMLARLNRLLAEAVRRLRSFISKAGRTISSD